MCCTCPSERSSRRAQVASFSTLRRCHSSADVAHRHPGLLRPMGAQLGQLSAFLGQLGDHDPISCPSLLGVEPQSERWMPSRWPGWSAVVGADDQEGARGGDPARVAAGRTRRPRPSAAPRATGWPARSDARQLLVDASTLFSIRISGSTSRSSICRAPPGLGPDRSLGHSASTRVPTPPRDDPLQVPSAWKIETR